ncbi:MAG: hypothetical protein Q9219_007014 [cf. Caloplaca sp. 3 TL-2023]
MTTRGYSSEELVKSKIPVLSESYYRTATRSTSNRVSTGYMTKWKTFEQEVRDAFASQQYWPQHRLIRGTPYMDPNEDSEISLVANEKGVAGRFQHDIGHVMTCVGYDVGMRLRLGDWYKPASPDAMPDMTIWDESYNTLVAGEIKAPWTMKLQTTMGNEYTNPDLFRRSFTRAGGQIANYMKCYNYKYGLLTEYTTTVFFKQESVTFDAPTASANKDYWELGHSGNFQFAGCGDTKGRILVEQLHSLYTALGAAIQDAKKSLLSPSQAYKIFLKDRRNASFIAKLLTNVQSGVAKRSPHPPLSNGNPTFICIDPAQPDQNIVTRRRDGSSQDVISICNDPSSPVAFYLVPNPYIILCSQFFDLPPFPKPGTKGCPVVDHHLNRFIRTQDDDWCTGSNMFDNMQMILLEEIVHYYLYADPAIKSLQPEVHDINDAWALSPTNSLGNAVSYVYYVGVPGAQTGQGLEGLPRIESSWRLK